MKLHYREKVDGTTVTIGKRGYFNKGRRSVSRKYTAEYRDVDGKQNVTSLGTSNKAEARRKAYEIQQRLDDGVEEQKPSIITIEDLIADYREIVKAKGAAPTTLKKYRTDLEKFEEFCGKKKIHLARRFSGNDLYRYRQFLVDKEYAPKTVQGAITIAKQMFKWAKREGILKSYKLDAINFPKAQASPQPCFITEQVDILIANGKEQDKVAYALMGFAGLRIGEVEQLQWKDIVVRDGQYVMLHVRRGGSNGTTKDRDHRFVPIHPKIACLLDEYAKGKDQTGKLLPTIRERKLLVRLKKLCAKVEFENPTQYKLHTFRHHFASMCANHGVAHRKALAWLGHSNSDMLDLYYHLHDDDSLQTMAELAKSSSTGQVIQYPRLRA